MTEKLSQALLSSTLWDCSQGRADQVLVFYMIYCQFVRWTCARGSAARVLELREASNHVLDYSQFFLAYIALIEDRGVNRGLS